MIEADGVQSPTDQLINSSDTPSITFANYNHQYNNMYEPFACGDVGTYIRKELHNPPDEESEFGYFELIQPSANHYHGNHLKKMNCDSQRPWLDLMYYYIRNFSQSMACIATRFGECSLTMLHKLWYNYTYIYHHASPNTATYLCIHNFLSM